MGSIKCEVRVTDKYGGIQKSVCATQKIRKGEIVLSCDSSKCGYYQDFKENPYGMTKDEVDKLCIKHPEYKDTVHRYSYMTDDDTFYFGKKLDKNYLTYNLPCICTFINHSCDPNCFGSDTVNYLAKRDIESGEEVTYDFQFFGTEVSYYTGLVCKCGSNKCRGILNFDHYRDPDWIKDNYPYVSFFMQKKIDDLYKKWFSSSCYLKKYNEKTELGLTTDKKVKKNELVAIYCDPNNIKREAHYLRHNNNPTCYFDKNGYVYANADFEPGTELTLDFTKI